MADERISGLRCAAGVGCRSCRHAHPIEGNPSLCGLSHKHCGDKGRAGQNLGESDIVWSHLDDTWGAPVGMDSVQAVPKRCISATLFWMPCSRLSCTSHNLHLLHFRYIKHVII